MGCCTITPLWKYTTIFISSSTDDHSDCFQIFIFRNNVTLNILLVLFWLLPFSILCFLRELLIRHMLDRPAQSMISVFFFAGFILAWTLLWSVYLYHYRFSSSLILYSVKSNLFLGIFWLNFSFQWLNFISRSYFFHHTNLLDLSYSQLQVSLLLLKHVKHLNLFLCLITPVSFLNDLISLSVVPLGS